MILSRIIKQPKTKNRKQREDMRDKQRFHSIRFDEQDGQEHRTRMHSILTQLRTPCNHSSVLSVWHQSRSSLLQRFATLGLDCLQNAALSSCFFHSLFCHLSSRPCTTREWVFDSASATENSIFKSKAIIFSSLCIYFVKRSCT